VWGGGGGFVFPPKEKNNNTKSLSCDLSLFLVKK